ncbi:MAG: peptidoglycan-associated lipoprotein Pal [Desulfuromonadaceae bacterium]|nr:peptidoglycan-associated lipoprotein Pal [Desulfuromonadaceae bacterium]
MKGCRGLTYFFVVVLVALLATACAKKPVVDSSSAGESTSGITAPGSGTTGYGGFGEQSISEQDRAAAGQTEGFQGMGSAVPGLERIFFEFDRYTLSDEARAILSRNADFLKANPDMKIIVEGHCDERGSDEYNLALGERRARAVQNYLSTLGVSATRLRAISYGEEIPLDRSGTEAAWSRNRRVEFKEDR